jgi:hypothetical protein
MGVSVDTVSEISNYVFVQNLVINHKFVVEGMNIYANNKTYLWINVTGVEMCTPVESIYTLNASFGISLTSFATMFMLLDMHVYLL